MPYRNAVGMTYDSGTYEANLDLAMRIAARVDTAVSNSSGSLRPLTVEDVIRFATRADGQRVSDATKQLALLLYRKLNEV